MSDFILPVSFFFSVSFTGPGPSISDDAFQEVEGLESEIDVETVVEGGENTFVHKLPKQVKHPNLKLKRGLTSLDSDLVTWCKDTLEAGLAKPIKPNSVVVNLNDAEGNPVASWTASNAYPVKWTVGGFDAMKNEIAIETIELAYTTLKRDK